MMYKIMKQKMTRQDEQDFLQIKKQTIETKETNSQHKITQDISKGDIQPTKAINDTGSSIVAEA